jgi:hypothetical protein
MQVGDTEKEKRLWRMPEDVVSVEPVLIVAGWDSQSDLLGHICAAIVASPLEHGELDREQATAMVPSPVTNCSCAPCYSHQEWGTAVGSQ